MVSKPDTSLLTWVSNEVLSAIDFDVRIGNLTLEAQRGTGKHLPWDVFFFWGGPPRCQQNQSLGPFSCEAPTPRCGMS